MTDKTLADQTTLCYDLFDVFKYYNLPNNNIIDNLSENNNTDNLSENNDTDNLLVNKNNYSLKNNYKVLKNEYDTKYGNELFVFIEAIFTKNYFITDKTVFFEKQKNKIKRVYSIVKKMKTKEKHFFEIYDDKNLLIFKLYCEKIKRDKYNLYYIYYINGIPYDFAFLLDDYISHIIIYFF